MAVKRATSRVLSREAAVEPHPLYHSWYLVGDFVHQRANGVPRVVRREEKCSYCPTVRMTRIDVKTWTRIRNRTYRYVKGVVITRMSKPEFLKREFLASTDLTGTDLATLQR